MMERRLPRALSVVVGIAAVAAAVFLVARDASARDALAQLALLTIGIVVVLQAVNIVTDSIRYRMVLPDRYRAQVPVWSWHRIFAVGRMLNMLAPQAGTAYRAAHMRLRHGLPLASFFGSIAAITWLGNGIALVITGLVVTPEKPGVGLAILAVGVALLAGIALLPRFGTPDSRGRAGPRGRLARAASGFVESFVDLTRRKRFLRVLGVSVLSQLSGVVAFVLVGHALGVSAPIVVGSVLYASTTIATVVSLTPGGLGITELAAGLAGSLLDIGAGVGVLVALIIRLTGTLAVVGLALVAAIRARRESPVTASPDAR